MKTEEQETKKKINWKKVLIWTGVGVILGGGTYVAVKKRKARKAKAALVDVEIKPVTEQVATEQPRQQQYRSFNKHYNKENR